MSARTKVAEVGEKSRSPASLWGLYGGGCQGTGCRYCARISSPTHPIRGGEPLTRPDKVWDSCKPSPSPPSIEHAAGRLAGCSSLWPAKFACEAQPPRVDIRWQGEQQTQPRSLGAWALLLAVARRRWQYYYKDHCRRKPVVHTAVGCITQCVVMMNS